MKITETHEFQGNVLRITRTVPPFTPEEEAEKKLELARQAEAEASCTIPRLLTSIYALSCQKCGTKIGWVHECDLNNTYFFCFDCVAKEMQKL